MTTSARGRSKIIGSLTVVLLSAASMIWLFWRHPLSAGLATLGILTALGISAYLARWIEPESSEVGGLNGRG
jgi:hypothetical protein